MTQRTKKQTAQPADTTAKLSKRASLNSFRSFSLSALLFLITINALLISCQQQQAQTKILNANYVNLNDILQHQQSLVLECRRLEAQKLLELKQLIEFDRDNDQVHLSNPVALKLPAVCLFLNGPPGFNDEPIAAPSPSNSIAPEYNKTASAALRLDLVNWLYDANELLPADLAANKTKRQAGLDSSATNSLVQSNWFDMNKVTAAANEQENEINLSDAQVEEKKLREQVERMIKDTGFKEALAADQEKIEPYLSPVILVPGLAGSRLQARVSKPRRVNIICKKEHDWQEMWLTLRSFLPVAIDCWLDNVRLEFDPTSGFTREPAGVESRVPQFGSVESVRHLDLKSPQLTKYFDEIIERYTQLGYVPDKNLFAAPYDFRLAPQQIEATFFGPLRELIEHANGGAGAVARKRVTLLCHSMGCTHLLIFLRAQSSAWRQARVRKVIALSSPWGGSIKALKALLVGEQFNIPLVSELKMRSLARSFPGLAYMLPQAEIFGAPSAQQVAYNGQLLVQSPEQSFRVDQLEALLKAAGLEQHWAWYTRTVPLIAPLEPLADVNVDCIHSLNVPTTETIIFRNAGDFPNGAYELVEGDGDGTVNHQSLLVCATWAAKYPQRIKHKVIMNTSHSGILSHKATLEHITDDVVATEDRLH